jgi:hypothetical protein
VNLDDVDAALDSLIRPTELAALPPPTPEAALHGPSSNSADAADSGDLASPGSLAWPGRSEFGSLFDADSAADDPLPLRGSFDEKIAYFRDRVKRAEVQIQRQRAAWQTVQSELDLLERLLGEGRAEAQQRAAAHREDLSRQTELQAALRAAQAQHAAALQQQELAAQQQASAHAAEHAAERAARKAADQATQAAAAELATSLSAAQAREHQLQRQLQEQQAQAAAQRTVHRDLQDAVAEAEERAQGALLVAEDKQTAHAAELALRDRALQELKHSVGVQQQNLEARCAQLQEELQRAVQQQAQASAAAQEASQQQAELAVAAAERAASDLASRDQQLAELRALLEQEQNGHRRAILEMQATGAQKLAAEAALLETRESRQQQQAEHHERLADLQQAVSTRDDTLVELKAQHQATLQRLQRLAGELESTQQRLAVQQQTAHSEGLRRQDVLGRSRRALAMAKELLDSPA